MCLPAWLKAFFATKPVYRHGHAPDDARTPQGRLAPNLGPAAPDHDRRGATVAPASSRFTEAVRPPGPSVLLSFLLAVLTAGLTALCYAELSFQASGRVFPLFRLCDSRRVLAFVVAGRSALWLLEYGLAGSANGDWLVRLPQQLPGS